MKEGAKNFLEKFLSIFSKKINLTYKGKILLTFSEKPGVFEVWRLHEFRKRTGLKKVILLYKEEPSQQVKREAYWKKVELKKIPGDPAEEIKSLHQELENRGEKVVVVKIEDIADRSIMRDAF